MTKEIEFQRKLERNNFAHVLNQKFMWFSGIVGPEKAFEILQSIVSDIYAHHVAPLHEKKQ